MRANRSETSGPMGCSTSYGQSSKRTVGSSVSDATQVDPAEADGLGALLVEPGEPGVVALVVLRAAVQAGVLEPELDVRRQVHDLALHDPRVATVDPAGQPFVPRLVAGDHPVGQHLRRTAHGQQVGDAADDVLDDAVAGQSRVAVDQPLPRRRGDHERRVRRDEVELVVGDRLEEAALAHLDPVGDLVELGVEPGQPQRALVHVGGDDPFGVGGQVQRLHSAAGTEVERAPHRLAHGQLGQRGRGRADAEHVVGGDAVGLPVEPGRQVAGHPEVEVVGGIGAYVDPRTDLADRPLEQPGVAERVEQPGERLLDLADRDGRLEQPQPGQRLDGGAAGRRPEAGKGLVARERGVGRRTQRSGDAVVGEPRPDQRRPQPGRQPTLVHHTAHASGPRQSADRALAVGQKALTGQFRLDEPTRTARSGCSGQPELPSQRN